MDECETISEEDCFLEEGEIVDDDDGLEQISSDEMTNASTIIDDNYSCDRQIDDDCLGKCVSYSEHLRAMCLSNGHGVTYRTFFDPNSPIMKLFHKQSRRQKRQMKLLANKHFNTNNKNTKRTNSTSNHTLSQDEDCEEIQPKSKSKSPLTKSKTPMSNSLLKEQFKQAVQIDTETNNCKRNSLRIRLGFEANTKDTVPIIEDDNSNAIQINNEKIQERNEDTELEDLRLEALRSAVLNKCIKRKKNKEMNQNLDQQSNGNKENSAQNNVVPFEAINSGSNDCPEEEDEDVLRATLLAAVSKNIIEKQTDPNKLNPNDTNNNNNDNIGNTNEVRTIKTQQICGTTVVKRHVPIVKPLIINVNDDSDSEDDDGIPCNLDTSTEEKFSNSVDRFLKHQRAKVDLLKEQRSMKSVSIKSSENDKKPSSSVKLLPHSQQLEYLTLMKRLRIAEIRKRFRNKSDSILPLSTTASNSDDNNNANSISNIEPNTKQTNHSHQHTITKPVKVVSSSVSSDLQKLQQLLKEIKMPQNGSLQAPLRREYLPLMPLLKRMNMFNSQRRIQESRVKKLQNEFLESKRLLVKYQEQITTILKELLTKKIQIDTKSSKNVEMQRKTGREKSSVATTAILLPLTTSSKSALPQLRPNRTTMINNNNIRPNNNKLKYMNPSVRVTVKANQQSNKWRSTVWLKQQMKTSNSVLKCTKTNVLSRLGPKCTSTPKRTNTNNKIIANNNSNNIQRNNSITNMNHNSNNNQNHQSELNNNNRLNEHEQIPKEIMVEFDIKDPNDIESVNKAEGAASVMPYTSPLTNCNNRSPVDPEAIICPFEMNGSCRDSDCTYKHYKDLNQ